MSVSYMDYTSMSAQFSFDLNNSLFFKKDNENFINVLSINQLNTLGNVSMLDIYLSAGNVVEPHIHQNATELVYCVSGAAVVSLVNPFTKMLQNYPIKPGQVANVPQGWWHYEIATADDTHLIAIFDAPIPEFIGGSDLLRLTPAKVFAEAYCLDEAKVKETFAPIKDTVFIGPPKDCKMYQTQEVQGIQTNQEVQGIQANQKVQGIQANQEVQGVQVNQEVQGIQANQEVQGIQANQEVQGIQANQEVQGIQANQEVQGVQVNQGVKGTQGLIKTNRDASAQTRPGRAEDPHTRSRSGELWQKSIIGNGRDYM